MSGARTTATVPRVLVVLLILLTSSTLAGLAAASPLAPSGRSGTSSDRPTLAGPPVSDPPAPSVRAPAPATGARTSAVVERVERQIAEHLFDGSSAFLPSPYTHFGTVPRGAAVSVVPVSAPGPMGVADLGIGSSGAPYEYNTSSFNGTVDLASFAAYSPGYADFAEAPNEATIQLNAVGANISYPGAGLGTFWFQNVVHFNGSAVQFEDNIWNFSSPTATITSSTLYSHAPTGKVELAEFYFDYGPTLRITYPFSLSLGLTLAKVGGRPAAFFNYSLTESSGTSRGSYDEVVFNAPATEAPQFRVDGGAYDPFGNEYDAELIFGGNGDGTNAMVQTLAGSATLTHWNALHDRMENVPSAYDHGVDSGETSEGIAAYYPSNDSATEYLDQGPSMLYGLWNTSTGAAGPAANPGSLLVTITLSPSYAFLFATNYTSSELSLAKADYSYAPSGPSGIATTLLPVPSGKEPYVFAAWADGYATASVLVSGSASATQTISLASSPTTFDAPIYLDGDTEARSFGADHLGGTGYAPVAGKLWINASQAAVVAPFLTVNGFDYPTFVLFAAEQLNLTVHVNDFTQKPSTFVYISPYDFYPLPPAGWTQGYYFFYGAGAFSVSNTTLTGNTTLYYDSIESPAAVEFFDTHGASAAHIVTLQESFGVTAVDSSAVTFSSISSSQGANAISLVNSTKAVATGISTTGTDYTGFASLGAFVYDSANVNLSTLTAAQGAYALFAGGSTGITVSGVSATTTGTAQTSVGVDLNDSSYVVVRHLAADASVGVDANATQHAAFDDLRETLSPDPDLWTNSTYLTIDGLRAGNSSAGASFADDDRVTVDSAYATDYSTAVGEFVDSSNGTFSGVVAANSSIGLNATFAGYVSLTGFKASNGSLAALLTNVTHVEVNGLSAALASTGLLENRGSELTIRSVNASDDSLGLALANSSGYRVFGVAASEASLVANTSYYSYNPFTFRLEPVAGVALYRDGPGNVSNVSAHDYPFAVWANYSNSVVVRNVTAWDGYVAVALNTTHDVEVAATFAYGNDLGIFLANTTYTTITGSTIEGSTSYGVEVDNGTFVWVYSNNFVANNGSDTKQTFQADHRQAEVINGTDIFFNGTGVGNYWSDHAGSGTYTVRAKPAVVDHYPQSSEIAQFLEFTEVGLPAGTSWGFALLGSDYVATVPLVYIPSWSLPDETSLPYTVLPTPGYVPHPGAGETAPLARTNQTITIDFLPLYSVTFTETGLPVHVAWSVTLNETLESSTGATPTITFEELSGSYPYVVSPVPGWKESALAHSGTVTVASADVTEKTLAYSQYLYSVTFSEQGLSAKTKWTVSFNGTPASSNATTLVLKEPNGTFPYTLSVPGGYSLGHASGSLVVDGADASVLVQFNASASPSPGASVPWAYVGLGGVVVLAAIAAVVALRRRRPPPSEPPFQP